MTCAVQRTPTREALPRVAGFKAPFIPTRVSIELANSPDIRRASGENDQLSFENSKGLKTLISPPMSPARQKSIFCDPLTEIKEEDRISNEPVGANDFADAVALSILDKVDGHKEAAEWKI